MQRIYAITGLNLDASRVICKIVGAEQGVAMRASGIAARKVALWRNRAASSRSELVILIPRLVYKTKLEMISGG